MSLVQYHQSPPHDMVRKILLHNSHWDNLPATSFHVENNLVIFPSLSQAMPYNVSILSTCMVEKALIMFLIPWTKPGNVTSFVIHAHTKLNTYLDFIKSTDQQLHPVSSS